MFRQLFPRRESSPPWGAGTTMYRVHETVYAVGQFNSGPSRERAVPGQPALSGDDRHDFDVSLNLDIANWGRPKNRLYSRLNWLGLL